MKKNVESLLQEIIASNPSLKKQEAKLKKIISEFLKHRPDSIIDEQFKQSLRVEIMKRCSSESIVQDGGWGSFFHLWWKPFVLGGVFVLGIAFVWPILEYEQGDELEEGVRQEDRKEEGFSPLHIVEKEEGAFGTLVAEEFEENKAVNPASADMNAVVGRGGGGGYGMETMIMPPMPPYGERINYEYLYEEELPKLPTRATVYKKTSEALSFPVSNLLQELDVFGLIDLQKLQAVQMGSIALNEDREKGYSLNIDFVGPSVGIYQNYQKWPDPYRCEKGICPQPEPLREKDMPSDATLIGLADDFLNEYKVPREYFGMPKVQKYWEEPTYRGSKPEFYPDYMTVLYPFVIDGTEVTDMYGNPQGVSVGINIRLNAVASAYFSPLVLESSHYGVKTAENILEEARSGGSQGFTYNNPDKTVTLRLGTPEYRLVYFSRNNEAGMRSDEFYMPALVFPVAFDGMEEQKEQMRYYPIMRQIVVPLVQPME